MSRSVARLPLVIGVTGHRDLREQDVANLETVVRVCLRDLRTVCPNTPFVLLSPLAEGADRLVARLALDEGVRLVVPLPLPRIDYENDFVHAGDPERTSRSKAEFEALLRRAECCFELPLVKGNSASGIAMPGPERDRQYAQVGAYIVRNSHILIALWDGDGKEPEATGSTAQIVRYRLTGLPGEFAPTPNPLDAIDAGPVLHVVAPREKNAQPQRTPSTRCLLIPGAQGDCDRHDGSLGPSPLGATLRRLDGHNRDAAVLSDELSAQIAANRDRILRAAQATGVSTHAAATLDRYALADTMALHFHQRRRRVLIALFAVAVAAVLFFEVYAHLVSTIAVLALYPLALLGGFGLYRFAKARDYHNKHLDYRALAEGLRVQLFWQLAGLSDEVSDHYLRKQRTELEWIREALRTHLRLSDWASSGHSPSPTPESQLATIRDQIVPRWIAHQREFFTNSTQRDRRKIRRRERWALWLLIVGMGAGAMVVALQINSANATASLAHHVLVVLMGFAPAIAAAIGGYAERMAFASQAKRYQWMAELFARAGARLDDAIRRGDTALAQHVILELGSEALSENGDWVLMHRDRPPEAPQGG